MVFVLLNCISETVDGSWESGIDCMFLGGNRLILYIDLKSVEVTR